MFQNWSQQPAWLTNCYIETIIARQAWFVMHTQQTGSGHICNTKTPIHAAACCLTATVHIHNSCVNIQLPCVQVKALVLLLSVSVAHRAGQACKFLASSSAEESNCLLVTYVANKSAFVPSMMLAGISWAPTIFDLQSLFGATWWVLWIFDNAVFQRVWNAFC